MVRKALNGQQLVACTQVISTGAQGLASIIEWKRQCGAKFVGLADAPLYNLDNEINGHLVKALDKKPHGAVLLRGKTSKHPDLGLEFSTAECLAETITHARAHKSQNVKVSDPRPAKRAALGPRMRRCTTGGCETSEDWGLVKEDPTRSLFYANSRNECKACWSKNSTQAWANHIGNN